MSKLFARGAAAVLVLAVFAVGASTGSAATPVKCGTVMTPTGGTGPVTVTGTTCKSGRYVAKTFSTKGKVPYWSCSAKAYEGGANVICRKKSDATVRVKFQVAD